MTEIEIYKNISLQKIKIEDVSIGLRQIGSGTNLVFIHGFPTHGYTWRKLIPKLSENYKCHILDLPGLGDSNWTDKTDFKSSSQARYIVKLLEQKKIEKYSLIAHNSGATIARVIAITQNSKVENLILLNTEIPFHRPPWIPLYQKMGLLPLIPFLIRKLLGQKWFVESPMGFREFYSDKTLLNTEENILPYLDPVIKSSKKTIGAFKYLRGIDWQLIDEFEELHKQIKANVLFIWGEDDKTFPIELGKRMITQFNSKIEFVTIKNASLLPHEEKPAAVLEAIRKFIKKTGNHTL